MRKPILFSDCDGVVYDTIDTAFEIMRQDGVDMKNHAAIDEYFRLWIEWDESYEYDDLATVHEKMQTNDISCNIKE